MTDSWRVAGYTEVRVLGRGVSGTVVEATDDRSGEPVAIKYLAAGLLADDGFRAAFRSEARVLAEIESPRIVRLLDYIEHLHHAAVVTEFVPGGSVLASLATHGPAGPESALAILKSSLHGLDAAHRVGLAHRDLKPKNVLITLAGDCKLVDFGVGRRAHGGVGTLAYRPPEYGSTGLAGQRGDIYAAAAIFVECLTGRPPVAQDDRTAFLPDALRDLAQAGLSLDRAVRPSDVGVFLALLERAAVRAYGWDWEERGRRDLAHRSAHLAHGPAHRSRDGPRAGTERGPTAGVGAAALLVAAIGLAASVLAPAAPDRGGPPGGGRPPSAAPPGLTPPGATPPGGAVPPWATAPVDAGLAIDRTVLPVVLAAPTEAAVALAGATTVLPVARSVAAVPLVPTAPATPTAPPVSRAAPAPLLAVRAAPRPGPAVDATPPPALSLPRALPRTELSLRTGLGSLGVQAEVGPGLAVRVVPGPATTVRKAPAARGSRRTSKTTRAKDSGGPVRGLVRELTGRRDGGNDDSGRRRQSGDKERHGDRGGLVGRTRR